MATKKLENVKNSNEKYLGIICEFNIYIQHDEKSPSNYVRIAIEYIDAKS